MVVKGKWTQIAPVQCTGMRHLRCEEGRGFPKPPNSIGRGARRGGGRLRPLLRLPPPASTRHQPLADLGLATGSPFAVPCTSYVVLWHARQYASSTARKHDRMAGHQENGNIPKAWQMAG